MYESGNEESNDNTVEQLNDQIKQREAEAERTRLNTIHQMEINRENLAKKEKEEEDKRQYLMKLSEALGINQQREEIDKLNLSVNHLAGKSQEMIDQLNNITKILNGSASLPPAETLPANNTMEKLQGLSQLIQPLVDAYKTYKNLDSPPVEPLISQDTIREKMVQTFNDNLETGETINAFIKNSLKKTVTRKIVNQALSEIGSEAVEHGPI